MSDWKSLISSEASAGISFSSVLIGIGTAIVGASITSPPPRAIEIILLSGTLILITCFYSAICYANTHGTLRSAIQPGTKWQDQANAQYLESFKTYKPEDAFPV